MFFDSHCHIQFPEFEEDLPEVINHAFEVGVENAIVVGTNVDDSQQAIAIARQYPELYAAVGIHPHDSEEVDVELLDLLTVLLDQHKVVAIGEVGLDYYRSAASPIHQQKVMAGFIHIARKTGKPVIIHQRIAEDDVYRIIKGEGGGEVRGVMHCFSGGIDLARQMLELGFYISFAGNISFKNYSHQKIIRYVPLDRLLLETDAPYLTPEPHRGKRNEPAYVRHTTECASRILGIPVEELGQKTCENARRLFGIDTKD